MKHERLPRRVFQSKVVNVQANKITPHPVLCEPEDPALVAMVRSAMNGELRTTRRVPVPISEVGVHNPAHLQKVTEYLGSGKAERELLIALGGMMEDLLRREGALDCYRAQDGCVVMFDSYLKLCVARSLQAQGQLDVVFCDVIEAAPSQ